MPTRNSGILSLLSFPPATSMQYQSPPGRKIPIYNTLHHATRLRKAFQGCPLLTDPGEEKGAEPPMPPRRWDLVPAGRQIERAALASGGEGKGGGGKGERREEKRSNGADNGDTLPSPVRPGKRIPSPRQQHAATVTLFPARDQNPATLQPLRYLRLRRLLTVLLLVIAIFPASHLSRVSGVRIATVPSRMASVIGPVCSK